MDAISVAPPVNWLIICAMKKTISPRLVMTTSASLLYLALKYPTTVTAPVRLDTIASLFPSTPSTRNVTGTWIAAIHACAYPYVRPAAPGPDINELAEVYVAMIVMARTIPFIFLPPMKYFFSDVVCRLFSALLL